MRRRDFLGVLGGSAIASPLAARAQTAMPVVAFFDNGSPEANAHLVAAFRKGLNETGFAEGRNVAFEYRWLEGHYDRVALLVDELISRGVALFAAPLSIQAALAAKAATTSIPIIFGSGVDPIQLGLVRSLNRPGGNVTGVSVMNTELGAKRLGLLHELVPQATRFAVLVNPKSLLTESVVREMKSAAAAIGIQIEVLAAGNNNEIDTAFGKLVQTRVEALLVAPDTLFVNRRVQLTTLATRHAIPAIYTIREIVEAGGLMSYGSSFTELFRLVGVYAGRILKGEKPSDLPVLQPTKFELVINLQTAKALGLTVPATLLARADEVIE
jgi:putative ABC transport system substrate-binding protein